MWAIRNERDNYTGLESRLMASMVMTAFLLGFYAIKGLARFSLITTAVCMSKICTKSFAAETENKLRWW